MRRLVTSAIAIALIITCSFIENGLSQNGKPGVAKEAVRVNLPMKDGSVRFLVIGDTGSGAKEQQRARGSHAQIQAGVSLRVRAYDGG